MIKDYIYAVGREDGWEPESFQPEEFYRNEADAEAAAKKKNNIDYDYAMGIYDKILAEWEKNQEQTDKCEHCGRASVKHNRRKPTAPIPANFNDYKVREYQLL